MSRSFSPQKAARAQQLRTEIGRLLKHHYEVSSLPLSGRLAGLINQIESSGIPVSGEGLSDEQAK
jgi:hypothetical protein